MAEKWDLWARNVGGKDRLYADREPLKICVGDNENREVVIYHRQSSNVEKITIEPKDQAQEDLFDPPLASLVIQKGEAKVVKLKNDLGIRERPDKRCSFVNTDPPYAVVITWNHPGLEDTSMGEHEDWHIEC